MSDDQIGAIKKAVEKLSSKKEGDRIVAQHALDALGATKLDVLLALLEKETADRRKRRRGIAVVFAAYFALVAAMIFIPMMFGHKPLFQVFSQFGTMTAVIGGSLAVSAAQKNATNALAEFDDPRAVGWWVLALGYGDKKIAESARVKLTALLPKLSATDSHLLDAEQRAELYKALGARTYTVDLQLAILKALEQVGDEKAIPPVEKLATGEGLTARCDALRIAAVECLPALRQRAVRARASETLLRASSSASAQGDSGKVLLRAAGEPGTANPNELLRATGSKDMKPDGIVNHAEHYLTDSEIGSPATNFDPLHYSGGSNKVAEAEPVVASNQGS